MFKSEFQGGNYFEVFNPTAKEPLSNFRVVGAHGIQKFFEKEVKGSVFQLEGTPATTKIALPKESKQNLSLVQRCICFQLYIKHNYDFSIEIGLTDLSQNKRNLLFSTCHRELNVQPLSARIPLKNLNRSQWTNLVFDLASLISEIWKNQTFKSIDSLVVCANCRLRKIFTLKNVPSPELGLIGEEFSSVIDFSEEVNSKLQIFSLNETKTDNLQLNNSAIETPPMASARNKSQNVFKIAFGTKIGSAQTPIQQKTIKQAKSQNQLDIESNDTNNKNSTNDSCENKTQKTISFLRKFFSSSEGNNLIVPPLPMSVSNSNETLTRRKSESDNNNMIDFESKSLLNVNSQQQQQQQQQQPETQTSSRKTTSWNQRAIKSAQNNNQNFTEISNKALEMNNLDLSNKKNSVLTTTTQQINNYYSVLKNADDLILKSNKIPHPPPQSTRPSSSSAARKIRLTSSVKQQQKQQNQEQKNIFFGGGESSNDEDAPNNSSKTLIDYSTFKTRQKKQLKQEESENFDLKKTYKINNSVLKINQQNQNILSFGQKRNNDLQEINSLKQETYTNNNIKDENSYSNAAIYSFSSKPKPVSILERDNNKTEANKVNKIYDPKRYSSMQTLNQDSQINENKNFSIGITSIAKDSLMIEANNENLRQNEKFANLMDSFEANMLLEMKAEMEANTLIQNKEKKVARMAKNEKNRNFRNDEVKNSGREEEEKTRVLAKEFEKQKSPDIDYIEMLQREASGLQSPLSDDYNQTTSEKYNYDAMTSSIDETSTSLSKKTSIRRARLEESNNYQEEMNISLQSNLASKSMNIKDLPSKYSPSLNQGQTKLQTSPIREEPSQYDDSQADIDEIDSGSDQELDLLYDPALNCYYDPKTCTYYELNMS